MTGVANMANPYQRILGCVDAALLLLASLALFALMGLTFVDVAMRSILNASIQSATELTRIFMALMVFAYTLPIYAWILTYIWRTGSAFFAGMMPEQVQASFIALTTDYKTLFFFAALNLALIGWVVKSGLEKGVERLNLILLPLLAVIVLVCIVIGLQYDTAGAGLAYLFRPDWAQFSIHSVTAAVGQAFFAIGIGMLGSMVFGSYIKRKHANILRDSSIISGAIVCAGIAAGLMIFPIVFAFGLQPAAGAGLTMITLPNVFNHIAAGQWVGVLFYVGFYFAAFTSAIGVCEALIAVFMDVLAISRKKALALVMGAAVVIGGASIAVPGFLDWADLITSNYLFVLSGFAIAVFAGWIWGADNVLDAAGVRHPLLRGWLRVSLKYICPIAVAVVFAGNFV